MVLVAPSASLCRNNFDLTFVPDLAPMGLPFLFSPRQLGGLGGCDPYSGLAAVVEVAQSHPSRTDFR